MLEALKFVANAIDLNSGDALAHFRIKDGLVKGSNGVLTLCAPINLDLDVTPNATQFINAIANCHDVISMHVNINNKLAIKSGKFKALISCLNNDEYPDIVPDGKLVMLDKGILDALKQLQPFVDSKAKQFWARGILFKGVSAFATSNIVLIEKYLGYNFPMEVNISKFAIDKMIKVNEEPVALQISENTLTFRYADNKWLSCLTLTTGWPDLSKIFNAPSNQKKLPDDFFQNITDLVSFFNQLDLVYLNGTTISSRLNEDDGAVFESADLNVTGAFNYKQMLLLKPIVQTMDLSTYPKPCLFFGDNIRGAIIGSKV